MKKNLFLALAMLIALAAAETVCAKDLVKTTIDSTRVKSVALDSANTDVAKHEVEVKVADVRTNPDNPIPFVMTRLQMRRRLQSNVIRRQELVFKKLEQNPVYGSELGFKGIIDNKYAYPVTFKFTPLDGGESKSVFVLAGKMQIETLVPGTYAVQFLDGGRELCSPSIFTVNAVINSYGGTPCHWFAYMPSRH